MKPEWFKQPHRALGTDQVTSVSLVLTPNDLIGMLSDTELTPEMFRDIIGEALTLRPDYRSILMVLNELREEYVLEELL
jgi:hypothetical protein